MEEYDLTKWKALLQQTVRFPGVWVLWLAAAIFFFVGLGFWMSRVDAVRVPEVTGCVYFIYRGSRRAPFRFFWRFR